MIRYLITGSSVVWTRLCATTTHAFLNVGTSLVLQPGSAETATWGREGKARAVVRPSHRGGSGLSGGWNRLPGNPHTRQVWGTKRGKCNFNLNISHEYLLSNLLNLFGIYFEQFLKNCCIFSQHTVTLFTRFNQYSIHNVYSFDGLYYYIFSEANKN